MTKRSLPARSDLPSGPAAGFRFVREARLARSVGINPRHLAHFCTCLTLCQRRRAHSGAFLHLFGSLRRQPALFGAFLHPFVAPPAPTRRSWRMAAPV